MVLDLSRLHTFGDSHSSYGWSNIDGVKINHLGAILCHSFGKHHLNRLNIKNHGVEDDDYVCFCFGEIDCRCHIKKYDTEQKPYNLVIDELIDLYFEAIKKNVLQFNKLNILVFSITPPLKDDHPVVIKNKNIENNPFPFLGNEKERKSYVQYFNQKLKEKCSTYGYTFLNVYDDYSDKEGFLLYDYSDGHVHIDNPVHIKNFLNNYG